MKRLVVFAGALALGLAALAPAVLAADPLPETGRVILSTQGDVVIPAGEHADAVILIRGHAEIQGEVNSLVVIDGTATLTGATLETVVAISSQIEVSQGTVVRGELQRLDSIVHQVGNADIRGGIVDLSSRFLEIGSAMAPALAMLWIGFGLSTIVAGLFIAALAARQVRSAERVIGREPLAAGLTGLLAVIAIPLVAILLFPTVVGAPLGLGILLVALPLIAFAGYLVGAVWVGDAVLRMLGPAPAPAAATAEPAPAAEVRPYLATVIGIVILGAIGLVPVLGFIVAIVSLLGFGAVILQAVRTITSGARPTASLTRSAAAPVGA
jgi:hypothetical protein